MHSYGLSLKLKIHQKAILILETLVILLLALTTGKFSQMKQVIQHEIRFLTLKDIQVQKSKSLSKREKNNLNWFISENSRLVLCFIKR